MSWKIGRRAALGLTLISPFAMRNSQAQNSPDLPRLAVHDTPQPLPELSVHAADGTARPLSEWHGRGVVLNFWATWCAPCVKEMPALDRLAQALADDDCVVLPLSSDRGGAPVVERFYTDRGIAGLPVLLDPRGAMGRAAKIAGLPTTLLINRAGQEVARSSGDGAWDTPGNIAFVRRLLTA